MWSRFSKLAKLAMPRGMPDDNLGRLPHRQQVEFQCVVSLWISPDVLCRFPMSCKGYRIAYTICRTKFFLGTEPGSIDAECIGPILPGSENWEMPGK